MTIMLLVVCSTAWSSCSSRTESTAGNQSAKIQKGNISINILASGNLQSSHEANLAFYSSGTVQEVMVQVGDMVKEGQELAKLEIEPLQSSLEQAQINVKQAQMNLENAEQPKTNSSGSEVISAPDPLNIEIKELSLKNAKNNMLEAQKKLDKATIIAPFAGLITAVN